MTSILPSAEALAVGFLLEGHTAQGRTEHSPQTFSFLSGMQKYRQQYRELLSPALSASRGLQRSLPVACLLLKSMLCCPFLLLVAVIIIYSHFDLKTPPFFS